MRVYIAGPMRGIPEFNFPMFHEASRFYRASGYDVVSPAEHDLGDYPDISQWPGYAEGDTSGSPFNPRVTIMWDLQQVADADGVVLLPGWENSSGVAVELALAKFLRLEVIEYVSYAVH